MIRTDQALNQSSNVMLKGKKIGILGVGNMGRALMEGLLKSNVVQPEQIGLTDKRFEILTALREEYGVRVLGHSELIGTSDILILACKPQDMAGLLREYGELFHPKQIVISIAAGIQTKFFEERMKAPVPIIRVMPNLPVTVGTGASAFCLGEYASWPHGVVCNLIFSAVGVVVEVSEDQMDTVTALSGTGPAYIFLLAEALAEAATQEGLPSEIANYLTIQTLLGGAQMMSISNFDPASLRAQVTSPNGTTAAAMSIFEKDGFRPLVSRAVHAARQRSAELSAIHDQRSS